MKQKGLLGRTTVETKNKVIELYQKGFSQNHIEKALHMTRKTIRTILENADIKRTKYEQVFYHHIQSTLREDAFDVVSDDMAYWLGFIYADGYVTNAAKTCALGILLQKGDKGHLEKFKDFMKAPQNIYDYPNQPNVSISIGSQRLHAALLRWGITNRKSYDAVCPMVMLYNRHFWRGMVDGDGYVKMNNGYPRVHLCGTEDIVRAFRNFLVLSGVDTESVVAKSKDKNLFTFYVTGDLARGAAKILYDNSNYFLNRKYEEYCTWDKINNQTN